MNLWYGWGDAESAVALPPNVSDLLEQAFGVKPGSAHVAALDEVRLPPTALDQSARDELAAAVGEAHVRDSAEDRIRHTRGKSTVDLLRLRAGEADDAPDAVVLPGGHDDVAAVLEICSRRRIAVVPFGGGTSVVGGLAAAAPAGFAGVIALDLSRMDRLVSVDPVSRVAVFEPGVRAPQADALLSEHGFQLGHFPQSYEYASIGGFAATRSSGQFSAGYGRFDEMVVGLRAATPVGTIDTGRAPRSAAGPDLRQLLLGSEGTFGVITSVSVRIHPIPTEQVVEAWGFDSFLDAITAIRRLVQDGRIPTMIRISDETETMLGTGAGAGVPCVALLAYEGRTTDGIRAAVAADLGEAGARALPETIGPEWLRTRYQAPYLRDALLDTGALAETLETAIFWSGLPALYQAVRTALTDALTSQGTPPVVLCHVSHVYSAGASLYFTVVCAQNADPVAQWREAKQAANRAIIDHGGTITHHHAVGTDHAAAYAEEVGPVGLAALRAVKRELDPAGILNPGVLLG
jgi:alkyldihydroxyacetonephosphate synthase